MTDDLTTKPTIETILERLAAMEGRLVERMDARFDALEERVERLESSVDRFAAAAYEARADIRELKKQLKEHLPTLK